MYLSVGSATVRARKPTAAEGLADRRRAGSPGESSLAQQRIDPRRANVVSPERGVPPHVARWFVAHARSGLSVLDYPGSLTGTFCRPCAKASTSRKKAAASSGPTGLM